MRDAILSTSLEFSFKVTKLLENRMHSSLCDVRLEIEFNRSAKNDEHRDHLTILRWWIDNILDNCIAFNVDTEVDTKFLEQLDNHMMFCPGEPHDYLLLLLINAKINAIGNGAYNVIACSINSNGSLGFGNNFIGDPLAMLPNAESWMGDVRYFDQPWWERSDGSMIDMAVLDGEDINTKPDILIDLREASGINAVSRKEPGELKEAEIIKPNFRPTIITKD